MIFLLASDDEITSIKHLISLGFFSLDAGALDLVWGDSTFQKCVSVEQEVDSGYFQGPLLKISSARIS